MTRWPKLSTDTGTDVSAFCDRRAAPTNLTLRPSFPNLRLFSFDLYNAADVVTRELTVGRYYAECPDPLEALPPSKNSCPFLNLVQVELFF